MARNESAATVAEPIDDVKPEAANEIKTWSTYLARYEDGRRVEATDKTFEWWYFDTILNDGSTCVVTFLNKTPFISGPLKPTLQINISRPNGEVWQDEFVFAPNEYSANAVKCEVFMGSNNVRDVLGDLQQYELNAGGMGKKGLIGANLKLTGVVPAWRTGPYLSQREAAAQWLGEQVIIPSGTVEGQLHLGSESFPVKGTCYHDHQWGGVVASAPNGAVDLSWYWGRFKVVDEKKLNERSIVFASVLYEGKPAGAMFVLANGTRILFDEDPAALTVTPKGKDQDPKFGINVDWRSKQGEVHFEMSPGLEIANFDGKYRRFLSDVALNANFAGDPFSGNGKAIWEKMTF